MRCRSVSGSAITPVHSGRNDQRGLWDNGDDGNRLAAPEVIAREIVEDLTAALVEFEAVAAATRSLFRRLLIFLALPDPPTFVFTTTVGSSRSPNPLPVTPPPSRHTTFIHSGTHATKDRRWVARDRAAHAAFLGVRWLSTDVVEAVVRVHGGVKFYRGAPKAARAYVERDRSPGR